MKQIAVISNNTHHVLRGKSMDAHFMLYLWVFFQSKIVRVLNLWQKNGVFMSEVIQPLLDLTADPNNPDLAAQGM
jgi:hypothetical protein